MGRRRRGQDLLMRGVGTEHGAGTAAGVSVARTVGAEGWLDRRFSRRCSSDHRLSCSRSAACLPSCSAMCATLMWRVSRWPRRHHRRGCVALAPSRSSPTRKDADAVGLVPEVSARGIREAAVIDLDPDPIAQTMLCQQPWTETTHPGPIHRPQHDPGARSGRGDCDWPRIAGTTRPRGSCRPSIIEPWIAFSG